ncbi:MAG TPA: hypothetical protein DCX07_12915 [Phycisphaerales bacterium]|nr:hypothetical protein [Phycisphaerales bacterium]
MKLVVRIMALHLLLLGAAARGEEGGFVNLFDAEGKSLGWSFGNGPEFPGATGGIEVEPPEGDRGPALKLTADLTQGGLYVHAGRSLPNLAIRTLMLEVKSPQSDVLKFRVIDSGGQCHQVKLRIQRGEQWQQVVFPLETFFQRMGKPDAVPGVAQYQYWGGAKDGKWHGPATGLYFLTGTKGQKDSLWLRDVRVAVGASAESAPAARTATWVRLDELLEGQTDWNLGIGQEFRGAKGALDVVANQPEKGQSCLKLHGDFTAGGRYVEAQKDLRALGAEDLVTIRFRARLEGGRRFGLRLVDSSGQTHQKRGGIPVEPDGKWRDYTLKVSDIAGSESWGGAKDGKWHGPPKLLTITLPIGPDEQTKTPSLFLANVEAEVVVAGKVQPSAYREDFEKSDRLPTGWESQGEVSISAEEPFQGARSLCVARSQEKVNDPAGAAGPAFAAAPGQWELGGAFRADLFSPDNSYNAVVTLECLDAGGRRIGQVDVAELYGKVNWQPVRKRVALPEGTASARFRVQLNKTYGRFRMDDLSAAFVAPVFQSPESITRALLRGEREGNMFYPGDAIKLSLKVEAARPLPPERRTVTFVLRDYWGAEQAEPLTATLEPAEREKKAFLYTATLDLAKTPLETGRYYELHIEIPRKGGESFTEFTSLAVLPEAEAKKHPWKDIPFTSRNWDNRIVEYFTLSDRLGLRVCGIWSRWKAQPPYKPSAPRFDLIEKYGMGAVMGTVGNTIEYRRKGYEEYDETSLREGAANLVKEYGKDGRIIVCLGNEPHGKGEKVLEDVRAYKAMYEGAKRADPSVLVLGTSSGPMEEYFQAGYGQYCDVYDFHTYNDVDSIRRTFEKYRELFKKYGHPKPIWSTELGLNSQGMTRRVVAGDLVKKFATFFACGGQNASWFGLLYPDPEGKNEGSSGQSHNVFFCRYKCYSPKLDAIAYYNMVNGICVKKFVVEKQYDPLRAILFRDEAGQCLQVLWSERGAKDVFVPLKGVGEVRRIRIDGGIETFDAGGAGLTLRVDEDPILLLYADAAGTLPDALGAPAATLTAAPAGAVKGGSARLALALTGLEAKDVTVVAPPFWKVAPAPAGEAAAAFTLTAPTQTLVRDAPVRVLLNRGGKKVGELAFLLPVRGVLDAQLLPLAGKGGKAGAALIVANNGDKPQEITWRMALAGEAPIQIGKFNLQAMEPAKAYFAEAAEGTRTVPPRGQTRIEVPLAGVDPLSVYRVKAVVVDPEGRIVEIARYVGGFLAAPRADKAIQLDGRLDEDAWGKCPVAELNDARQARSLRRDQAWKGPEDLSAKLRFLWDDKGLYVAMEVTDDVFSNPKEAESMWNQDGLQFLIDPFRAATDKGGKYDYSLGLGQKGPQAWCHLAPAGVSSGEAKDVVVAAKPTGKAGGMVYEVFFPWARLAPFSPAVGANLGIAAILNEDDGPGRASFMTWFGDIQTKEVDAVGDVILAE